MIKREVARVVFACASVVALVACARRPTPVPHVAPAPSATPTEAVEDPAALLVGLAVADLAALLDLDPKAVAVERIEPTEFPDASLGLPEPGQSYAQVVTPGYIIELSANGQIYLYHAAGERVVAVPRSVEPPAGSLTIQSVRVTEAEVIVRGATTLPAGACIKTDLLADGEPLAWWASDACATVDGGSWEVVVALAGEHGLRPDVQYAVDAYAASDPDVSASFPFDLDAPLAPPTGSPPNDPVLLLPDSAEVAAQVLGDLDGDGAAELVLLAGYGGEATGLGYEFLQLFILTSSAAIDAIAGYEIAWQSDALIGQRAGPLTLQDLTGDGRPEVLSLQSMGAAGQALYVVARSEGGYRLLRPAGGYFDDMDYFGEKGVRLLDEDGDGIVEISAAYGPAASLFDTYAWDGGAYVYQEPRPTATPEPPSNRVPLSEAGISIVPPAEWERSGPAVWSGPGGGTGRLGVKWVDIAPPQEPEAALLPQPAQVIASEPIDLAWGSGRTFTLEVFAEAVEGEGQAPVARFEKHALIVVEWDGGRRAFDVYVSAPTAEGLAGLEGVLDVVLASVEML
jgi:hypothetical protein